MHEACPHFTHIDTVEPTSWEEFGTIGDMSAAPFKSAIENFYMTDPISRASETMAACTREFILNPEGASGTDG